MILLFASWIRIRISARLQASIGNILYSSILYSGGERAPRAREGSRARRAAAAATRRVALAAASLPLATPPPVGPAVPAAAWSAAPEERRESAPPPPPPPPPPPRSAGRRAGGNRLRPACPWPRRPLPAPSVPAARRGMRCAGEGGDQRARRAAITSATAFDAGGRRGRVGGRRRAGGAGGAYARCRLGKARTRPRAGGSARGM